jgi:hypothetical protein
MALRMEIVKFLFFFDFGFYLFNSACCMNVVDTTAQKKRGASQFGLFSDNKFPLTAFTQWMMFRSV